MPRNRYKSANQVKTKEVIKKIAKNTGLPYEEVDLVFKEFLNFIAWEVKNGEGGRLPYIGNFVVAMTAARKMNLRHNVTGKLINNYIPPRKSVKFRFSQWFIKNLNLTQNNNTRFIVYDDRN